MDMKRALLWYLGILAVMAVGVYLGLELFVNKAGTTGSAQQEALSVEPEPGTGVEAFPPGSGTSEGEAAAGDTPAAAREAAAGTTPDPGARVTGGSGEPAPSPVSEPLGSASAVSSSPGPESGNFTVQVAALSSPAKADELISKLRNDGFPSGRIAADIGDSLNRIWVGSFASREEASAMAERLKGKGYNTYVRTMQ